MRLIYGPGAWLAPFCQQGISPANQYEEYEIITRGMSDGLIGAYYVDDFNDFIYEFPNRGEQGPRSTRDSNWGFKVAAHATRIVEGRVTLLDDDEQPLKRPDGTPGW